MAIGEALRHQLTLAAHLLPPQSTVSAVLLPSPSLVPAARSHARAADSWETLSHSLVASHLHWLLDHHQTVCINPCMACTTRWWCWSGRRDLLMPVSAAESQC